VAARRLILAMILLLVLSSAAAALVPVGDAPRPSSTGTMTVDEQGPSGKLVGETLRAGAKKPQRVRIRVGDQLALQVTSKVADQVEIPGLGEIADVDRDAPARFDLLPFEPGSYAVRLVDARRTVGRIVVRAQPRRDRGGSSIDSPGSSTAASTAGARLAT
jgi:hypothetical protein